MIVPIKEQFVVIDGKRSRAIVAYMDRPFVMVVDIFNDDTMTKAIKESAKMMDNMRDYQVLNPMILLEYYEKKSNKDLKFLASTFKEYLRQGSKEWSIMIDDTYKDVIAKTGVKYHTYMPEFISLDLNWRETVVFSKVSILLTTLH